MVLQEGISDLEIAQRLDKPIKEVYRIRTRELKISYYGKKKICDTCHELKSLTVFLKGGNTCIKCRRVLGAQAPYKMVNPRKQVVVQDKISVECIRCRKDFDSETWEKEGRMQHYYACSSCRRKMNVMDSVGI